MTRLAPIRPSPPRPWRRVLTEAQRVRVAALYEAGWSVRTLAKEFGCSTAPIMRALQEQSVPRRETNNPAGRAASPIRPQNARASATSDGAE